MTLLRVAFTLTIDFCYAERVPYDVMRLYNLVEVDVVLLDRNPGCAARPWALLWNAFGVVLGIVKHLLPSRQRPEQVDDLLHRFGLGHGELQVGLAGLFVAGDQSAG